MNSNISKCYVDVIEVVLEHPENAPIAPAWGEGSSSIYCDTQEQADQYRLLQRPKTLVEISVIHDDDVANPSMRRFPTEREADEYIEWLAASACACGNLTAHVEDGKHVCRPCRDAAETWDPHEWILQYKNPATNRWNSSWRVS